MNPTLASWNALDQAAAAHAILPCCGSRAWAEQLANQRPLDDETILLETSSRIWLTLPEAAWNEAFNSHPRIGEQHPQTTATPASLASSAHEQSTALASAEAARLALQQANRAYEKEFGRIFIVCASGKSSEEILAILQHRRSHDAITELHEAAEQQRQITELRLRRWLGAH